jgi:hypothetical protein
MESTTPLNLGETTEEELWKEISGFEGHYWVSNLGNVKGNDGVLEGRVEKTGYIYVTFVYLGQTYRFRVHRLVAETFLEYDEERNIVDHIDRNKQNNKVTNLRWVTHRENCWNRKGRDNKTGYSHVTKVRNKYYPTKTRGLGLYNTAEEAHNAAISYRKDFNTTYKDMSRNGII